MISGGFGYVLLLDLNSDQILNWNGVSVNALVLNSGTPIQHLKSKDMQLKRSS